MSSLLRGLPYYEAAKLTLDEPARLMNEGDLRKLCNKICDGICDSVAWNLAQHLGMQKEYELIKHEANLSFKLLSLWIRKEGATLRILRKVLGDMGRTDCVDFIDNTVCYKFVKLCVILYIPSVNDQTRSERIPINADQVPERLSLRNFVKTSDAIQDEIKHLSTLSPVIIRLNRLENLNWDSPSGDYVGRQIDLHLLVSKRSLSLSLSPREPSFGYTDQGSISRVAASMDSLRNQSRTDDSESSHGYEVHCSESLSSSFSSLALHGDDSMPHLSAQTTRLDRGTQSSIPERGATLNLDFSDMRNTSSNIIRDTRLEPSSRQADARLYSDADHLGIPTDEEFEEVSHLPGFRLYSNVPDSNRRAEAKKDIQKHYNAYRSDGCYLIRESQSGGHRFTLTFGHSDMIYHISIIQTSGGRYALHEQPSTTFDSVYRLIEYYKKNDIRSGVRLSIPVM